MKRTENGIIGNADVAALYTDAHPEVAEMVKTSRERADRSTVQRYKVTTATRRESKTVTRTIVVSTSDAADTLARVKGLAKEYFTSHKSPWILDSGESFYS